MVVSLCGGENKGYKHVMEKKISCPEWYRFSAVHLGHLCRASVEQ